MADPTPHDQPVEGGDLPEAGEGADRGQPGRPAQPVRPTEEQADENRQDDPPA